MRAVDLGDRLLSVGRAHFSFEANGHRIAYCYIRKNACTAFKQLICRTSPFDYAGHQGDDFGFLARHHKISLASDLWECSHRIFVYRDPFERLASTFVNKFVKRDGHFDIFKSFQSQTGLDPDRATFEEFVKRYCIPPFKRRDPHIIPQNLHLLPIKYDAAIPLSRLTEVMTDLIGTDLAETFFAPRPNASSYSLTTVDLSREAAADLHAEFQRTRDLPSLQSLDTAELRTQVATHYQSDYRLIELIDRSI